MERIAVHMKDLKTRPLTIDVVGEDGRRKAYQLVPAGKLGACLNKAPDQKTK
jgi:hypothetical protein